MRRLGGGGGRGGGEARGQALARASDGAVVAMGCARGVCQWHGSDAGVASWARLLPGSAAAARAHRAEGWFAVGLSSVAAAMFWSGSAGPSLLHGLTTRSWQLAAAVGVR